MALRAASGSPLELRPEAVTLNTFTVRWAMHPELGEETCPWNLWVEVLSWIVIVVADAAWAIPVPPTATAETIAPTSAHLPSVFPNIVRLSRDRGHKGRRAPGPSPPSLVVRARSIAGLHGTEMLAGGARRRDEVRATCSRIHASVRTWSSALSVQVRRHLGLTRRRKASFCA